MVLVRSVRPTGNLWAAAWISASRRWFGVSAGSVHRLVATPLDAGLCPHTPRGDPRIEWRHLFPFAVRLPLHPSQRSRGHNETGVAGMEAALSPGPLVECSVSTGMECSVHQHPADRADHFGAWPEAKNQPGLSVRKPLPLCCGRSQLGPLGAGHHDSRFRDGGPTAGS